MTTISELPLDLLVYLISVAMPESRHVRLLELTSKRFKQASRCRTVIMLDKITSSESLAPYLHLRLILGRVEDISDELMKLPLAFLELEGDDIGAIPRMLECKYPIICHRSFYKTMTGKPYHSTHVYYRGKLRVNGHHHHWWNVVHSLLNRGQSFSFRGRDEQRDFDVEVSMFKDGQVATMIIRRFGSHCDIEEVAHCSGTNKVLIDYRAYDPPLEDIKRGLKNYANFDYAFV